MGLPRPLRLTRSDDFSRVRAEGRTYRGRLMLMNVAPNGLSRNRYGVVTGKRLGGAVVRNRVRRLLREAIRLRHPQLHSGWDVVLVAHPAMVGQPLSEVQRAFGDLAAQATLLREEESM